MFGKLAIGVFTGVLAFAAPPTCEELVSLTMQDISITSAARDTAGGICRVKAIARPVADSEIHVEVWLPPAATWNGKLLGTGNGGYSGSMSLPTMESAVKTGYAAVGSDTGHPGGDLKFGIGHPEKIADWGYRAIHVMTEVAKLTVRNYYGRFPGKAYFTGCSTGGQQALTEAQRYPADYDGIIAGDPGNNRVRLNAGFLWSWLETHEGVTEILTAAKLQMLNRAVVNSCDANDGVKDGIIDDPRRCKFDPATLLCKAGSDANDAACLTASQVSAVRKVYDGARNPRTKEQVFPGWIRGSETGWGGYFVGHAEPARTDFWRYWVFGDPKWDPASFDFDKDMAWSDSKMAAVVANDADLSAFRRNNGKLLMYHGFADPVVPPEDGIGYYEAAEKVMKAGGDIRGFFRLFMVPSMGHCNGGPGPSTFDTLAALDAWVTRGTAPDSLLASHSTAGKVDRTRPLCPYPAVAKWNGTGSTDEAGNFSCVNPPR